jgi:hypothetical protein
MRATSAHASKWIRPDSRSGSGCAVIVEFFFTLWSETILAPTQNRGATKSAITGETKPSS